MIATTIIISTRVNATRRASLAIRSARTAQTTAGAECNFMTISFLTPNSERPSYLGLRLTFHEKLALCVTAFNSHRRREGEDVAIGRLLRLVRGTFRWFATATPP